MFTPDVEELLKRFNIEKPNEQFEFGPVTPTPESSPDPLNKVEFDVPLLPLVTRLEDEATKVQDILDIISDTADELSVPVAAEEAGFLGQSITTRDYLKSFEATDEQDPLRHRKQQTFEQGVLGVYGDNPHWPVLMAGDLLDVRNTLLSARDMIEGKLLGDQEVTAASGGNAWRGRVLNSDLIHVHEQMILASEQVRFKVAQSVFTMNLSFNCGMLDHIMALGLTSQVEKIRPNLVKINSLLKNLRSIFVHSQLLLTGEFTRSRQAVLNIVESAILDRLINILVVKLSSTIDGLVNPVLDALEHGIGNGAITEILTDETSHQIASVLGGTIQAIVGQYKGVAADLIRQHSRKTKHQLDNLQFLGERNIVGRWIVHIDQVTTTIERVLTDLNLTQTLASEVIARALKPPSPPNLPILQKFLAHPELSQAQNLALKVRTMGITPQLAGPPVVPYFGAGPQLPDPDPAFGVGSVNPAALNKQ
jgi:hypothetical protein